MVKAKVKAVVGGGAYKNHGVVLSISTYESHNDRNNGQDLGELIKGKVDDIRFMITNNPMEAFVGPAPSWEAFLEEVKSVPLKEREPEEPDYKKLYKWEIPFLKRIFSTSLSEYIQEKRQEWEILCQIARDKKAKREALIRKFSKSENRNDYQAYIYSKQLEQTFKKNNISFKAASEVDKLIRDGYVTSYEQILYDNLKNHFPIYRQATIKGYSIDLLVAVPKTNKLWAIEVDGGIHLRETIIEKDHMKEELILKSGISIIRVTNYYIGRKLEKVLNEIIAKVTEGN